MRRYKIQLTGETDLIMHSDSISGAERVKVWSKDPANKDRSVAGDDRSPAWTWLTYLYHDGRRVIMPSDNVMTMLREAGAAVVLKGKKTFKSATQAGIIPDETDWMFETLDPSTEKLSEIDYGLLKELYEEDDFEAHLEIAAGLGIWLFTRRARIGQAKHIRVRPRFEVWRVTGSVTVTDDMLTLPILEEILTIGGRQKGLCDWRPSSRTPGPMGRFRATVEQIEEKE